MVDCSKVFVSHVDYLREIICGILVGQSILSTSLRIAVYDLGGGTFDVSILEIQKDVFEVCFLTTPCTLANTALLFCM